MTSPHIPASGRDFLFPGEAAAVLGVSTSAVRRYARAGLLPRRRTLGGQSRYDKAAILALRDQLTETVTGGAR